MSPVAPNRRRIAFVCMTPETDANEHGEVELPSYGVRRVLAATVADPVLKGAQIALIDVRRPDVEAYLEAIENFDPDLLGFSVYVWSTPCLVEVARRVGARSPRRTIVFGGPSARTAVFDLPPYGQAQDFVDAVVATEGETVFREIARLPDLSRAALATVSGLDLPVPGGWQHTGYRAPTALLDDIVSPYQLGIMDPDSVAYLETFRGCPFSCTFCEWGASKDSKAVFSVDYLTRDLEAYAKLNSSAVFSVDAGLNLNHKAFRNLWEAEKRVGALKNSSFWSEIYPSLMREEHLEFLSSVRAAYLGIGLQSNDPALLKTLERPFDNRRLETVVRQVRDIANAEVQIIMGLPGDSRAGFRRTLDYARSLGVGVRAYHTLVLPDALLTRGRPEWRMRFDPTTLAMQSCLGWSEHAIDAERAWLTEQSLAAGGRAGNYWWYFPPGGRV
jgi:radical SAM superfamily enzyme YgiQ (UPF0313 family)